MLVCVRDERKQRVETEAIYLGTLVRPSRLRKRRKTSVFRAFVRPSVGMLVVGMCCNEKEPLEVFLMSYLY